MFRQKQALNYLIFILLRNMLKINYMQVGLNLTRQKISSFFLLIKKLHLMVESAPSIFMRYAWKIQIFHVCLQKFLEHGSNKAKENTLWIM